MSLLMLAAMLLLSTAASAANSATQLAFTTQPVSTTAGQTMASVVVQIEDASGNPVSQSGAEITLNGVTLHSGANPQTTDSSGKATFSDLVVWQAGNNLALTANGGGLTAATSANFSITAAGASQLAFATQPGGATAGSAFGTQPVVQTEDAYGNLSTAGLLSSETVTIAIKSGTGTLLGTTSYDIGGGAGGGTITGFGLEIDQAGNFTLSATASGLAEADSSSFTVNSVSSGVAPPGWYRGDMHVHLNCGPGSATNSVTDIYNQMVNQDLSVVSLLADMGNGEVQDPTTDLPLVNGQDAPISTPGRMLHWDAEWHWDATYTQYPHQAWVVTLWPLG